MTRDDALKVFGLTSKPDPKTLKSLYRALQKAAALQGRMQDMRRLNIARDILQGKMAPDAPPGAKTSGPVPQFSGHAYVTCATLKSDFVMDWRLYHGKNGDDLLRFENPRYLTFDNVISTLLDVFKSRLMKARILGASSSGQKKLSDIQKATYEFPKTPCILCSTPNYDWCDFCGTLFCRPARDESLDEQFYCCPSCNAEYGWGEKFSGGPRSRVIDGSHFRALQADKRSVLINADQKRIGGPS